MFQWAGGLFDAVLDNYVVAVVARLMTALAPVALSAMTLWVLLYGWAVLRQDVSESIPTFVWKVFKLGLVLAFALQSGVYITNVSETANSLALGVATTFLPADVDPSAVSSPYILLDRFNDRASEQVADIMREASMFRLDLVLAAVVFSFGSVVFLCIALFVVTLSKVLLTFVIAIGPLFILCLAWRPTQRFFDSWLSMLLNTVVLAWFAFFALGVSAFLGLRIFMAITEAGGLMGGSFNVLSESIRYCILMILMGIICFQAPSLASALTGGPAVQQGMQMVQNAMMISGLRSVRGAQQMPPSGTQAQGGSISRPGAIYQSGFAVGSSARLAVGAARTAAYRLAALRGRT
jgi:type IV secretion system protein VirB6